MPSFGEFSLSIYAQAADARMQSPPLVAQRANVSLCQRVPSDFSVQRAVLTYLVTY